MVLDFEGVRWNKTKLNNYVLKFMHRILHAIKLKRFCDVQKNIVEQNRIIDQNPLKIIPKGFTRYKNLKSKRHGQLPSLPILYGSFCMQAQKNTRVINII